MYKNAKESLIEIVIGDAILELLEADAPISHEALLNLLHRYLEQETRETRREALLSAIADVKKYTLASSSQWRAAAQWGGSQNNSAEHRQAHFNSDPPGRGDKKH